MRSDPLIRSVELRTLPTRYPRTVGRNARLGSHGTGPDSRIAVLHTDDGRAGWGLVEQEGTLDTVEGRPLSELLDPRTGVREHPWLDIALHDLWGVVEDSPVHALLGLHGSTDVEVYDGAIYFDDLDDPERGIEVLVEEFRADRDQQGFRDVKLKIGRGNRWLPRAEGDARDVEVTHRIRQEFPDARILVDANDGYDLEGFTAYVDAVADVGMHWVEEPFLDDADDLTVLREHLDRVSPDTLIAEGETTPDVEALLPVAAVDVLLMDVMSFGFTAWREVMPRLRASASPHAWGRPLKTVYAAHLAAGLGNVDVVEGVPGTTQGVGSLELVDGVLSLGERPGFGLAVPV
jgi:D-galactarolactone cycloisomerase